MALLQQIHSILNQALIERMYNDGSIRSLKDSVQISLDIGNGNLPEKIQEYLESIIVMYNNGDYSNTREFTDVLGIVVDMIYTQLNEYNQTQFDNDI